MIIKFVKIIFKFWLNIICLKGKFGRLYGLLISVDRIHIIYTIDQLLILGFGLLSIAIRLVIEILDTH